jgi:3-dehydroquinate dehydratase
MRRPTFLKSHQKTLRTRPLIVGTIAGPHPLKPQIKAARAAKPDLIEIRLDTLPLTAFQEIHSKTKLPILLTIRSAQENGGKKPRRALSEAERLTLFRFLIPLCDMIDVELRHAPLIKALTPLPSI